MRAVAPGLVFLACLAAASAQPSTEQVTVTGTRSRQVIDDFIKSFAAPARMTGKMARWEDGICPVTAGLKPAYAKFITQRVRDVATQIGAPVNARTPCEPNIVIVFTTQPQALLDNVRKKQPLLLGYYDNSAQEGAAAAVTRPIQAWYATATKDIEGKIDIDSRHSGGVDITLPYPFASPGYIVIHVPHSAHSVTGGRLADGLHTILYRVMIVANPDQLLDHEIGTLADYISLLALTQLNSLDACQQLPSIVNLLAKDCTGAPGQLSESDMGYLRGLYSMRADGNLGVQQDGIAHRMGQ
jgi:hypothetical protein